MEGRQKEKYVCVYACAHVCMHSICVCISIYIHTWIHYHLFYLFNISLFFLNILLMPQYVYAMVLTILCLLLYTCKLH